MNNKKRIRVVFAINDFLVGGAQRIIADILRNMDRATFDPVLITLFYWEERDYFYELIPSDIPVYRFSFTGFTDVRSWAKLCRILKEISPEIVLSNLFFTNTVLRILRPFFSYKVIVVEHNTYVKKAKLHQIIDRILARVTAKIVAVSNTVATFTSAQERIPKEKFCVINNGIDIQALRNEMEKCNPAEVKKEIGIASADKVILSVARLTTQKNPRLLLDGFSLFNRVHPDYKLVMVGSGGNWDMVLRKQAHALGMADSIFILGTQKDVSKFYAIADFFISTSTIEGFGIAHTEALACGVPVLTTKTAGPDEMIKDGENGYFIDESTPESVAVGMEEIIHADSGIRARAAKSAETYSIGCAVESYQRLFLQILVR